MYEALGIRHEDDTLGDLITSTTWRNEFISNIRIMLTYEMKIDEGEYIEWMVDLCASKKMRAKEIRYSHAGDVTRILVTWNARFRSTNRAILDYKDCHPILTYIGGSSELIRAKLYIARHDACFEALVAQM